ncbi:MAG: hypothetical protein ACI9YE_000475 [Psychroserpens sp.]
MDFTISPTGYPVGEIQLLLRGKPLIYNNILNKIEYLRKIPKSPQNFA